MECGDEGTQVNGGSVDDANNAESIIVESQNRVENAISIAEETYEELEMRNEMWVNDEYKHRDKWRELFMHHLLPGAVLDMLCPGKVKNQTPKASKTKLVQPKTNSNKKRAYDHQWCDMKMEKKEECQDLHRYEAKTYERHRCHFQHCWHHIGYVLHNRAMQSERYLTTFMDTFMKLDNAVDNGTGMLRYLDGTVVQFKLADEKSRAAADRLKTKTIIVNTFKFPPLQKSIAEEAQDKVHIKTITLQNFGTFQFGKFHCGPSMNCIMGLNASGKTTFLNALYIGLGGHPTKVHVPESNPNPRNQRTDFMYPMLCRNYISFNETKEK